MKFQEGESVIILDTLQKPAGTARILGHNDDSTLYAVSYRYPGSSQDEQFEVPEQRLLILDQDFLKNNFASR